MALPFLWIGFLYRLLREILCLMVKQGTEPANIPNFAKTKKRSSRDTKDIGILAPEEDGTVGLGCLGDFPRPMTGSEALAYVRERFGLKIIRSSRPLETPITRVALLGGSGGSEMGLALARGAQLYITADAEPPLVR